MKTNKKKTMVLGLAAMLLMMSLAACSNSGADISSTQVSSWTSDSSSAPSSDPSETESQIQTTVSSESSISSQEDFGDGGIDEDYVDSWYLFGNLSNESLYINPDSRWEMRNRTNADGSGGHVFCNGYSAMDGSGSLMLYENTGDEVGTVTWKEDKLILMLSEDYQWTFEAYLPGDIVFNRKDASAFEESEPFEETNHISAGIDSEAYIGYWMYEDVHILEMLEKEWCLYTDEGTAVQWGLAEYTEDGAYLMNEDGSSGGGVLYLDEYGEAYETGNKVTKLDYFPTVIDH